MALQFQRVFCANSENFGLNMLVLAPIAREDVMDVEFAVVSVEVHHTCFPEKVARAFALEENVNAN